MIAMAEQKVPTEFLMTKQDFRYIRELAYESTGIVLADHKWDMIYSRLAKRVRKLKLTSFKAYCAYLNNNKHLELTNFINALTTNLTSFFREPHHFEFLKNTAVKEFKAHHQRGRRIRVWSSACSTGQEPYSMAASLYPEFDSDSWDLKILATDLDSNVLQKAKDGVYQDGAGLSKRHRKQWFLKRGEELEASPELKSRLFFKQLNLLSEWPMSGPFDAIFCRNVLIYFDQKTKQGLIHRFAEKLRPGGYLFLGHSESLHQMDTDFKLLGNTIYQRKP